VIGLVSKIGGKIIERVTLSIVINALLSQTDSDIISGFKKSNPFGIPLLSTRNPELSSLSPLRYLVICNLPNLARAIAFLDPLVKARRLI